MSETEIIGFVGLGAMGSRMAANVAAAGIELVCYDVAGTEERMPSGASAAASLADLVARVDVVVFSLPDGKASAAVAGSMIESNQRRVRAVIDTSTIGIAAAQEVHKMLEGAGIGYLDAPVSGGISGAAAATIALMFAGPEEAYKDLAPVISAMSKNPFYVGSQPGQGQAMKLLNNFLSGLALTATSEAIAFGLTQGLDMALMLDVLNASSGQNTATSDKFPNRILTETYDAKFLNTLYLKDLSLYVENSDAAGTVNGLGHALLPTWQRYVAEEPGRDFTEIFPFVRDKR
jgi:3-hydroxyisobutyrate dehydrogenase